LEADFGLAAYAVHRPHGSLKAGAFTVTAGLYELAIVALGIAVTADL
jgi:hypothetical protein